MVALNYDQGHGKKYIKIEKKSHAILKQCACFWHLWLILILVYSGCLAWWRTSPIRSEATKQHDFPEMMRTQAFTNGISPKQFRTGAKSSYWFSKFIMRVGGNSRVLIFNISDHPPQKPTDRLEWSSRQVSLHLESLTSLTTLQVETPFNVNEHDTAWTRFASVYTGYILFTDLQWLL